MRSRKEHDLDKIYKLSYVNLSKFVGKFQIPKLKRIRCLPKALISFKDAMKHNKFDAFVHFYLNDGEFERLWRNPERYINRLKKFNGVLTPDFSLYTDMPLAIQIWNVYRSRLMGIVFEQNGIKTIPTISWTDSRSFDFAFDGIPKHDVVSVSSVGIWKDKKFHHLFLKGLSAMIQKLQPTCIVFYGKLPAYDFGSISIIQQDPDTFFWKKKLMVYIIRRFKMGGRGSRSNGGHRAPNGYSTVGKIRGVRVIQDKKTGKGLPFHGPKNGSFYRKSRSGAVEQYRKYNSKGFPKKDIDTGHDHGQGDPHVHDWVNGKRQIGRPPTIGELNKIKFK